MGVFLSLLPLFVEMGFFLPLPPVSLLGSYFHTPRDSTHLDVRIWASGVGLVVYRCLWEESGRLPFTVGFSHSPLD